jgi:hypothetical protein
MPVSPRVSHGLFPRDTSLDTNSSPDINPLRTYPHILGLTAFAHKVERCCTHFRPRSPSSSPRGARNWPSATAGCAASPRSWRRTARRPMTPHPARPQGECWPQAPCGRPAARPSPHSGSRRKSGRDALGPATRAAPQPGPTPSTVGRLGGVCQRTPSHGDIGHATAPAR